VPDGQFPDAPAQRGATSTSLLTLIPAWAWGNGFADFLRTIDAAARRAELVQTQMENMSSFFQSPVRAKSPSPWRTWLLLPLWVYGLFIFVNLAQYFWMFVGATYHHVPFGKVAGGRIQEAVDPTMNTATLLLFLCCSLLPQAPTNTADIHAAVQATDLATVKRLVDANAALANLPDKDRSTPLHLAAARGAVSIAEYLLEKGAVLEASNAEGNTPLHAAAASDAVGMIALLPERQADVNATNTRRYRPLHAAIFSGKDAAARVLIERGADLRQQKDGANSPLHLAARFNRKAIVELLIAKGAEVDSPSQGQVTPLSLLTRMTDNVDVARLLIQKGADVNARDSTGMVPLEHAAHHGSLAMVDLLLDSGAGYDTSRPGALRALDLAAGAGSARLFQVVADKGGDDLIRDAADNRQIMNTAISGGSVAIDRAHRGRRLGARQKRGAGPRRVQHLSGTGGRPAGSPCATSTTGCQRSVASNRPARRRFTPLRWERCWPAPGNAGRRHLPRPPSVRR
jgi:ankyrin repeat protein